MSSPDEKYIKASHYDPKENPMNTKENWNPCANQSAIKLDRISKVSCNISQPIAQRQTTCNGLDLLCAASEKITNRIEIPKNCSCPRSRCLKLYCECFQSGSFCSYSCDCKHCMNTVRESGNDGARTLAVQQILSRNPWAFTKDKPIQKEVHRESCRCTKTQCIKLYCDCFLKGLTCDPMHCLCVKCLNTENESGINGLRTVAMNHCLEKNPNAFVVKRKTVDSGCSCKNSRCLKKYCLCFSSGNACNDMCTCQHCGNMNITVLRNKVKEIPQKCLSYKIDMTL